jgi:hypothetical protein
LTGDPFILGLTLALGGIPQAALSLFGGAIIDRFSPRRVMLLCDFVRLLLTAFFAIKIYSGTLETWMIFVYAFIMGGIYGIFEPASNSLSPRILAKEDLQTGNFLTQGSNQLIGIFGPILAAIFISIYPDDQSAIAILIAFDSLTFLVSIFTLFWIKSGRVIFIPENQIKGNAVMASTREGISYVFNNHSLFFMFIIIAIASFALSGTLIVGIPYLADTRYPEGIISLGVILSGFAAGNLLGILISFKFPLKADAERAFVAILTAIGVGIAALIWINTTLLATIDLFLIGMMGGYITILLLSGLQRNTPKEKIGRVMSLILFANLALIPFSQLIAGILMKKNTALLFFGASALLIALAFYIHATRDKYNFNEIFKD